jgi:hypothetical protein
MGPCNPGFRVQGLRIRVWAFGFRAEEQHLFGNLPLPGKE